MDLPSDGDQQLRDAPAGPLGGTCTLRGRLIVDFEHGLGHAFVLKDEYVTVIND